MPGERLLSIGLPVFNGAETLPRALESLFHQDFRDFEIVIVDNASTDDTAEVCATYGTTDDRVRYVRNDVNVGLVANFNKAFELSRGQLFKWATHDDWCDAAFLSECVGELLARPDTVLASTGVVVHDEHGVPLESWDAPGGFDADEALTRARRMIWYSGETHPLFGVVRREALRRTGLMQSYLGSSRLMLSSLALQGRIVVSPRRLYHYTYYRPVGRTYSSYNDPSTAARLPLRTWRLGREHAVLAHRSALPPVDKVRLEASVLARFGVRDARRLGAELYHSGRILAQRGRKLLA